MPVAIFLGKPSGGFMCCYITITQVVILVAIAGLAVSLKRLDKIINDDDESNDVGIVKTRYTVLIVFIAILSLIEIGVIVHITVLTSRTMKTIKQDR